MAGVLSTPRYRIQNSRFTEEDGWRLWDLSLSLCGNIAVSGWNNITHRTYINVYSVSDSDFRAKPKLLYSKEFEKYVSEEKVHRERRVSFVSDEVLVSCLGNKLEVFQVSKDEVLRSRVVNGSAKSLSVSEGEIFIGFLKSNRITVYDVIDLNEIKSIILQGIQGGYFLTDMTAIADKIFGCVGHHGEESHDSSLLFEQANGRILSELTKPTNSNWCTHGMTVSLLLGVVAVVWRDSYGRREGERFQIVFYSLLSENNPSFLIVEIESGDGRIRISDRGDRMVTRSYWTGEVKVYDVAELFTYTSFKEAISSVLKKYECLKLMNFFEILKDQKDAILKSATPCEDVLLALEREKVIQSYNIDRLTEAFSELNISAFCCHVAKIYQHTRTSTFYKDTIERLKGEVEMLRLTNEKKIQHPKNQLEVESTRLEEAPSPVETDEFSRLLVKVSVDLSHDHCILLANYFNFPRAKKDFLQKERGIPGIHLLNMMKESNVINRTDVTQLQEALAVIELKEINEKLVRPYQDDIDSQKHKQPKQQQD